MASNEPSAGESNGCPPRRHRDPATLAIVILTAVIALAYAAYTNHVWEDYFITFRASKNLALGKGLVFVEGQHVQTYTSPLGTLLPAALSWLTGNNSDMLVIWLFRIISIAALLGAVVLAAKTFREWRIERFFATCGLLLMATDCKTVDFTINGMETGFMLLFVSLSIWAFCAPMNRRTVAMMAAAFAGLMWTRPDGFVYAGSIALAFLIFRTGVFEGEKMSDSTWKLQKAVAWAVILYLPWLIFAFLYYGTVVSNTIVAKSLYSSLFDRLKELFPLGLVLFSRDGLSMQDTFMPAYESALRTWPWWGEEWSELAKVAAIVAAFHWLFPVASRPGRAVSLVCLLVHVYLSFVSPVVYPWYVPPVTFLTILSLMSLLAAVPVPKLAPPLAFLRWVSLGRLAAVGMIFLSAGLLAATGRLYAHAQRLIELGNRKAIGVWLHDNAAPGDTVFVECLGYIGYYSGLKMYDYPGLSSPEVVSARLQLRDSGRQDTWPLIIRQLRPSWVVLRPGEASRVSIIDLELLKTDYHLCRVFDVSAEVAQLGDIPGARLLRVDQTFNVYQRQDASKDLTNTNKR